MNGRTGKGDKTTCEAKVYRIDFQNAHIEVEHGKSINDTGR